MAKTVVGTFENVQSAERTAARLEDEGIDRRAIAVVDNATGRESEGEWQGKSGGFWSWLFGDVESDRDRGFHPEEDAYYTEQLGRGAAIVIVTTADENAERVRALMERFGADDVSAEQREPRTREASGGRVAQAGTGAEQIMPVVEEQVKIGKRAVERAGVRVYRHTTERPVEEHLRLREERIRVERRHVDRPVEAAAGEAFREETIELTETAEEPVVEKHARVVEEVVVTKDVGEREQTVRETARRGDVEVERTGGERERRGAEGHGFNAMESDFRQHCTRTFGQSGLSYEQCSPAYRYGYELASSPKYRGEWTAIESDARRDWEHGNPGTWERFRGAIRYAWDRARGRAQAA
jgi:uncharacterized protein (TIGR02271 family)